jgi:hypothetical protein
MRLLSEVQLGIVALTHAVTSLYVQLTDMTVNSVAGDQQNFHVSHLIDRELLKLFAIYLACCFQTFRL